MKLRIVIANLLGAHEPVLRLWEWVFVLSTRCPECRWPNIRANNTGYDSSLLCPKNHTWWSRNEVIDDEA